MAKLKSTADPGINYSHSTPQPLARHSASFGKNRVNKQPIDCLSLWKSTSLLLSLRPVRYYTYSQTSSKRHTKASRIPFAIRKRFFPLNLLKRLKNLFRSSPSTMRLTAILPVLCAIAALILSLLCIFAGSRTGFLQNADILTVSYVLSISTPVFARLTSGS